MTRAQSVRELHLVAGEFTGGLGMLSPSLAAGRYAAAAAAAAAYAEEVEVPYR